MQSFITKIVAHILARTTLLEDHRRRMFLNWLQAHHQYVTRISEEELKEYLTQWLEELSPAGVLWEYRLILSEIHWWRDLDEQRPATVIEVNR